MPRKKLAPYEMHEVAYKKIKAAGGLHWADRAGSGDETPIDKELLEYLSSILRKPWAKARDSVLEIGCGSAVLLRWLLSQGFSCGTGIDVSKSAIELAQEQSEGLPVLLKKHDHLSSLVTEPDYFDFIVDGHCLHCITNENDRETFFSNAYKLLKPNGVLVVSTMCSPVNGKKMREDFSHALYKKGTHYYSFSGGENYSGAIEQDGKYYVPQRYFEHWQNILRRVRRKGFAILDFHYSAAVNNDDLCSHLHVAAKKSM